MEQTLRTLAYLLGISAIVYADLSHQSLVFSVLLPVIVPFYVIFILSELTRFFVPTSWGEEYSIFDMLGDMFNLHEEAKYTGFAPAVFNLALSLLHVTLLFSSLALIINALPPG